MALSWLFMQDPVERATRALPHFVNGSRLASRLNANTSSPCQIWLFPFPIH
jgi:hypothetical protein